VPAFRLKADMIPGLINTIRFTPTVIGRYPIICTEFCGTDHGMMNAQVPGENGKANPGAEYVVVDSPADFQKWYHAVQLKNANASNALPSTSGTISLAGGDAAAGQALFQQKCSACHAIGPFSQLIGCLTTRRIPSSSTAMPRHPRTLQRFSRRALRATWDTCPTRPRTAFPIKT
jgi:hypothetical protein